MTLFGVVGWSHNRNPTEYAEIMRTPFEKIQLIAENLSQYHVILTTCNRVEIYFTTDTYNWDQKPQGGIVETGNDAILHLFRVACGLESMSVGENEILSQVKSAFFLYSKHGRVDKLISLVFRKAISLGKLVRDKTAIAKGKTSIPAIALDLASKSIDIRHSKVLIIGTGQMAETFLRYLMKEELESLDVAGRNTQRGIQLEKQFGVRFHTMEKIPDLVNSSQLVICATSARSIFVPKEMINGDINQVFIDISSPPNIDTAVANVPGRKLINLKTVESIASKSREAKAEEIPIAESIIEHEMNLFSSKIIQLEADYYISKSYSYAEEIAHREVARLLQEISAGKDIDDIKSKMVPSMIKKIMEPYISALREAALNHDLERMEVLGSAFVSSSGLPEK